MRIRRMFVSIVAVLSIFLGIASSNVSADDEKGMNGITINPLGHYYVFGPMVEYERLLNDSHGVAIGYSAISSTSPFSLGKGSMSDYTAYLKGTSIELTYRYRFENGFSGVPGWFKEGWWVGAGVNYLSMDYRSITRYVPKLEFGGTVGKGKGLYANCGLVLVHNGNFSQTVLDKGGTVGAAAFLKQYDNIQPQVVVGIGWAF